MYYYDICGWFIENLFSKGFQKVSPLVELNKQGYVQGELFRI